jgi:hypothetical protein
MRICCKSPKALILNPNRSAKGSNALIIVGLRIETILDDGWFDSRFVPKLLEEREIVNVADSKSLNDSLFMQ